MIQRDSTTKKWHWCHFFLNPFFLVSPYISHKSLSFCRLYCPPSSFGEPKIHIWIYRFGLQVAVQLYELTAWVISIFITSRLHIIFAAFSRIISPPPVSIFFPSHAWTFFMKKRTHNQFRRWRYLDTLDLKGNTQLLIRHRWHIQEVFLHLLVLKVSCSLRGLSCATKHFYRIHLSNILASLW